MNIARIEEVILSLPEVEKSSSFNQPLTNSTIISMNQKIPNKLKLYRVTNNLRQIDVAHKLGFTSSERISRWEMGLAYPSVVNLFKLAKLYNARPDDLYGEIHKLPDILL